LARYSPRTFDNNQQHNDAVLTRNDIQCCQKYEHSTAFFSHPQ
jgi:hypothetical protein